MPLKVVKRGDKYRLVNKKTNRIEKTKYGKAVDGGGHKTKTKAMKQLIAIEYIK